MSEGHEMRWGGLAGLASLVLAIVAGILLRGAPRITASSDTIALYLTNSRDVIMAAAVLNAAAVALFVWFGATLATAFRLADPNSDAPAVVLAGFVLTGTIGFLGASILGGTAYALTAHPMLIGLASAPYSAVAAVGTLAGMAVALPLAACAAAIARTGVLPQWAAWFSGFVAVIRILGALTVLGGAGAIAPGGVLATYLPGGLTALWIVVLSGLLVREHLPEIQPRRRRAPGPA
ncbi:hypothetical protein ACWDKQ_22955 [Saccharopolyspora sp. NPDC000995]